MLTGLLVAGLYCKRPIQCLASSKILTPHSLDARRVCTPPPFGAGEGHTRWMERGGGVNSSKDARNWSVLYKYVSTLWVYWSNWEQKFSSVFLLRISNLRSHLISSEGQFSSKYRGNPLASILFLKIVKKKDDIYNSPHSQSLFKVCTAGFRKDSDILKELYIWISGYFFQSIVAHKICPVQQKIFRALSVSFSSNLRTQRAGRRVSFCE